jgi:hypothetical protein
VRIGWCAAVVVTAALSVGGAGAYPAAWRLVGRAACPALTSQGVGLHGSGLRRSGYCGDVEVFARRISLIKVRKLRRRPEKS